MLGLKWNCLLGHPLTESAFTGAVPGSVWEVDIIREGWSQNGVYYSREALTDYITILEGTAVQYNGIDPKTGRAEHLPAHARQGLDGPAANQGGILAGVHAIEESGRLILRGNFFVTHPILQEQLKRSHDLGLPTPIPMGLSIDARAHVEQGIAEGRTGPIAKKFTQSLEVTVVTRPAAGGGILRLVASENNEEETPMSPLLNWLKSRRAKRNQDAAGLEQITGAVIQEAVSAIREDFGESSVLALAIEWIGQGKNEEAVQLLEKLMSGASPMMESAPAPNIRPAVDEATALLESLRLKERAAELENRLRSAKLLPRLEESIRKRFSGKIFTDAELQEAIVDLKEAEAAMAPAVTVSQSPRIQMGLGAVDKHEAAWDVIFGYDHSKDESLTEAQKKMRADIKRSGRIAVPSSLYEEWFDSNDPAKVGPNAILHEAATSANYPNILSTSISKRMVQVYLQTENMAEELVTVNPDVQDFKTNSLIAMGGFGDVPTVAEGAPYLELQNPAEVVSEYSLTKRGGLFGITWEMMAGDNIGQFRNIPSELARSCITKKQKFIYGLVIGGKGLTGPNVDTTYDGIVLYHTSHSNKGTSALSYTTFGAARAAIRAQKRFNRNITLGANYTTTGTGLTVDSTAGLGVGDYLQFDAEVFRVVSVTNATTLVVAFAQCGTTNAAHSSGAVGTVLADPIAVNRFHLLVPGELETTGNTILNSELVPGGNNNDYNQYYADAKASRIKIHAVDSTYLGGDVNNWYVVGDKSQVQSVELGYYRGQTLPEVLVADNRLVGAMFTNDQVQFKVRDVYGGKVVDWRGLYGAIVP